MRYGYETESHVWIGWDDLFQIQIHFGLGEYGLKFYWGKGLVNSNQDSFIWEME